MPPKRDILTPKKRGTNQKRELSPYTRGIAIGYAEKGDTVAEISSILRLP